jgi:uncharacterized protein YegP (UPF0339 family)
MAGQFELKNTKDGKFTFTLKAANGQVILTGETYGSKSAAQVGIEAVRTNAANDARYERKTSAKGEPFFVLKAANGEPIGTSEMYSAEAARENGVAAVKENAPGAAVDDLTA